MNRLYTAVGRLGMRGAGSGRRHPVITVNQQEYGVDVQEMMLWSALNWQIVSLEEVKMIYAQKEKETGYFADRSVEDCLRRLVQRGLVADGYGETPKDALYDLLLRLYVVPISGNPLLRMASFVRMTAIRHVPFSVAKRVFEKDKRTPEERQVMRLARRLILSTAEIVRCFERRVFDFASEEELLEALYCDAVTTSENLADEIRISPECRPVLIAVANLYLRRQILFDRL